MLAKKHMILNFLKRTPKERIEKEYKTVYKNILHFCLEKITQKVLAPCIRVNRSDLCLLAI